ncbi:hypothetical protein ACFL5V_02690 [Fibrobacterota bacterium]
MGAAAFIYKGKHEDAYEIIRMVARGGSYFPDSKTGLDAARSY